MEIDLALNNEVEDFKEDYESIYLEIDNILFFIPWCRNLHIKNNSM